jgi:nucleoside 2-deoxyribosyltransferase
MDKAPDQGAEWRVWEGDILEKMGIVVLNPCDKPIDLEDGLDIECLQYRTKLKEDGDYKTIASEMKKVRIVDLRMVDMADFLIVNLDTSIPTCGTHEEISWANRMKNPVLIHCKQGKSEIPDWMFGMIPDEHMFSTWDEINEYLRHVNEDEVVEDMKRWIFFDYTKLVPKVSIDYIHASEEKTKAYA